MFVTGLSNDQLIAATAAALTAAHGTGLAAMTHVNKDGKPTGERFVGPAPGWAVRANDWALLSDEVTKRGLPQPACNCPDKDANGICVKG